MKVTYRQRPDATPEQVEAAEAMVGKLREPISPENCEAIQGIVDWLLTVRENVGTLRNVERRLVDLWWAATLLGSWTLADQLWGQIRTVGRAIRPVVNVTVPGNVSVRHLG